MNAEGPHPLGSNLNIQFYEHRFHGRSLKASHACAQTFSVKRPPISRKENVATNSRAVPCYRCETVPKQLLAPDGPANARSAFAHYPNASAHGPPTSSVVLANRIQMLVMRLLNNSDSFIFAKGCLPGSLDLSQDLLSFSPPDVPLGFEVMPGEVLHDGIDQLAHAAEAAGQDRLLAQVSEEAFDQIHPG